MIREKSFGIAADGRMCRQYSIYNKKGEHVELLNVGASVHGIWVCDRNGKIEDVTLGAPDAAHLGGRSMEGVCIGRCANRIKYGRYEQDGRTIQLECNMRGHFLHGGSGDYGKKYFEAEFELDSNEITFTYLDTGEGGFEGNVQVRITYRFDDTSQLEIKYDMLPDADTVLCPTNHTYFNLSGGDVRDFELQIMTDEMVKRDADGFPDGGVVSVKGTPADFTVPVTLRTRMEEDDGRYFTREIRYDEYYVLKNRGVGLAASLYDGKSGRRMNVYTDMECLIFFNAIMPQPVAGKDGKSYSGYCGVCLETQFVPNAVNCPQYRSPRFRKGERLVTRTRYAFVTDASGGSVSEG